MGDRREDDNDGLLSRWSGRKAQTRAGAELEAPAAVHVLPLPPVAPLPTVEARSEAPPAPPAPTLDDVAALVKDSDYTRFVAPGVDENVKRAALKKLFFSDPHFNVMDGLDVYIDDYGKPDPIPASMLRRLVQSHALGLFDDEKKDPAQASPDGAAAPSLPQSPSTAQPAPDRTDEDTALRLQPDDAADAAGARADRPDPRT